MILVQCFNMKKTFILIFSLSLFAPVMALAQTPSGEADFCATLNIVRTQSQAIVSQKEKTWQSNLDRRLKAGVAEKDQAQIDLKESWKKEDEVWASRFTTLKESAQTEDEKTAALSLENKIKELIKIRRAKVEAAVEVKQKAKQALLSDYVEAVNEAVANFKVALNQEILQTQTACVSTRADDEVVGGQFKTDRQKLSQALSATLQKIKNDATERLVIINHTKDQAVNQAWTDFRTSLLTEQKNRGLK